MKLTLHPGSAVVGAVLVAVPFILMSAQEIAWPRQVPIPVSVQEMPNPHNMIVLRQEEGPYTVSAGKLFVLTGLGNTDISENSWTSLYVDGVMELGVDHDTRSYPSQMQCAIADIPAGFTIWGGGVIALDGRPDRVHRAWGYLVDA